MAWVIFIGAYVASACVPWDLPAKDLLLMAIAVLACVTCDRSWQGICLAVTTAVVGPAIEAVVVNLGLLRHLHSEVAGIPLWLCGLDAASSVAIGNLARWSMPRA